MIATLTLLFTGGCVGSGNNTKNNKDVIATSFYPIYIFTLNIVQGIDDIEVRCMAEQNIGCLHDYTLTAKDVRLLNDAKAFVINGAGMESFIEDAYENAENIFVIDSSSGISLICDDEHTHHEDAEEKEASHGHSHNHSENSHIWLSVENAKKQIENIKNGLVQIYPQYELQFEENYEAYMNRLTELEKETESCRAQVKDKKVITFHKAYDYLAVDTGFEIVACVESDEGGEPSAKKLAQLSEYIKNESICALFTEPQYKGSAADILKNETGISICVLNPVTSGQASLTSYEDIMKENYELLLKAVS